MRQAVSRAWGRGLGAVAISLAVTACGGAAKPPMVPDATDPAFVGDAGVDISSSAPAAPAPKK